jgi:hypothetical protein
MNALGRTASRASIVTTIIDAILEIRRGRRGTGAVLLAAAALSSKVPGLGTVASIAIRVARRMR